MLSIHLLTPKYTPGRERPQAKQQIKFKVFSRPQRPHSKSVVPPQLLCLYTRPSKPLSGVRSTYCEVPLLALNVRSHRSQYSACCCLQQNVTSHRFSLSKVQNMSNKGLQVPEHGCASVNAYKNNYCHRAENYQTKGDIKQPTCCPSSPR